MNYPFPFAIGLRPIETCPMCGASDAFDRPRFVEAVSHSEHYDVPGDTDWHIPEHLDWPCSTCGYVVETDTLEQRTAKSRGAA